jgi:hypothetical protein
MRKITSFVALALTTSCLLTGCSMGKTSENTTASIKGSLVSTSAAELLKTAYNTTRNSNYNSNSYSRSSDSNSNSNSTYRYSGSGNYGSGSSNSNSTYGSNNYSSGNNYSYGKNYSYGDKYSNSNNSGSSDYSTLNGAQAADGTMNRYTPRSSVSSATQAKLDALETDYNKVKWGIVASPTGYENIVVSIAPYCQNGTLYTVIAITNLYDYDVEIDTTGTVKGLNGEDVGDFVIYEPCLGSGDTILYQTYCDDNTICETYWERFDVAPTSYSQAANWESDWSVGQDEYGYYEFYYYLYSNQNMCPGAVTALALDSEGYIRGYAQSYNSTEGTSCYDELRFYTKEFDEPVTDFAMFANPEVEN